MDHMHLYQRSLLGREVAIQAPLAKETSSESYEDHRINHVYRQQQ